MRQTVAVPSDDFEDDELTFTSSDRDIITAINTARYGRRAVGAVRVGAVVVGLVATIGNALTALEYRTPSTQDSLFADPTPDRQQWAVFLNGLATPLALALLVYAASFLLALYCSRLEMDIVIAEQDERDEPGPTG